VPPPGKGPPSPLRQSSDFDASRFSTPNRRGTTQRHNVIAWSLVQPLATFGPTESRQHVRRCAETAPAQGSLTARFNQRPNSGGRRSQDRALSGAGLGRADSTFTVGGSETNIQRRLASTTSRAGDFGGA
jgi:hypothetical protein